MTNHETEPVCKFEQGCHRVAPCDPGCAAPAAVSVPPPAPQAADRRARYAAAIAEGFAAFDADTTSDAYLDAELLDAVIAAADAEEAELLAAVSVVPPAPRADDQAALRDRIAERPERYAVAIHDAMESDLSLVDQEPGQQALFARAAEAVMALADSEQATLRRKLAAAEKIRENADFHLGQEMARRQLAEKEAARLSADQAAVLNAAAQHLYTALFPAVYDDMGQKAAEGVNRAVSELRRLAAASGPVAGEQQNETPEAETPTCPDREPLIGVQCSKESGHEGPHSDRPGRIWYPVPAAEALDPRPEPDEAASTCTCGDAGDAFVPLGHYRDCPDAAGKRQDGAQP